MHEALRMHRSYDYLASFRGFLDFMNSKAADRQSRLDRFDERGFFEEPRKGLGFDQDRCRSSKAENPGKSEPRSIRYLPRARYALRVFGSPIEAD